MTRDYKTYGEHADKAVELKFKLLETAATVNSGCSAPEAYLLLLECAIHLARQPNAVPGFRRAAQKMMLVASLEIVQGESPRTYDYTIRDLIERVPKAST
jgi:hypothetical protein